MTGPSGPDEAQKVGVGYAESYLRFVVNEHDVAVLRRIEFVVVGHIYFSFGLCFSLFSGDC